MGQRTMGQRMPEQKHNPFQNDSDRRVVASVVWWKDVMVGIVAPRRRDGRSEVAREAGYQPSPCVLISGGETTVTVRGTGRGGRNVEFLLSLAIGLDGLPGVYAIAGDTDGVDGAEEIAGAIVAPDTLARAAALGVDAKASLADNDGHGFFGARSATRSSLDRP